MPDAPPDLVDRLRRFAAHRLTRLAVCWLVCLGVAAARWYHARHCFDTPRPQSGMPPDQYDKAREDGNLGHTHIDFGGQWVFGRTAAEGRWHELYDRDALRRTAAAAFPTERQSPGVQKYSTRPDRPDYLKAEDVKPDADRLLRNMMGDDLEDVRNEKLCEVVGLAFAGGTGQPLAAAACQDEARRRTELDQAADPPLLGRRVLGGPLYPPVHALLYAPLGSVDNPQRAYFLFQLFGIVAVFGSGLAVRALSRGRVWWPVATTVLFLVPGMRAGLDLGQNHAVTLCVVLTGWAVAARRSQFGGGMVWGVLAFKPVWGLAFILAAVLLRKWRFVAGTAVAGCSLVAATLPLVGVEGWKEWLEVGKSAADLYNVDQNWINLSRDVSGIPKRLLLDFSKPKRELNDPGVKLASNLLLAAVVATTIGIGAFGGGGKRLTRTAGRLGVWAVAVWWVRGYGTSFVGVRAGFVLLGGYLCCYRFMYYDAVLASAGFAALLAYPRWTLGGWRGELREANQPASRRRAFAFVNSFPLTVLVALILHDNLLIHSGNMITVANDYLQRTIPDPCGGTTQRVLDAGTTASGPKTLSVPRQLSVRADYNHPVDTFLVLAAWGWCGWRLVRTGGREGRE